MSEPSKRRLEIRFGALSDPIQKQIRQQGKRLSNARLWQDRADCITKLSVSGLLSDAETHRARGRFMRQIVASLRREQP